MSSKRGKNVFNDSWVHNKRFKSWVTVVPSKRDLAKCKLCSKEFKVDNGGIASLISHAKSKKHIELEKSASSYSTLCFQKNSSPKPADTNSVVNNNQLPNKNSSVENLKVPLSSTTAEIR